MFLGMVLAMGSGVTALADVGGAGATGPKQDNPPVITEGDVIPVTMSEDGAPTAFALSLNATDADADPLTWSIASPASNGTAMVTGNNTSAEVSYAPQANFNGADSFGVKVDDGTGGSDLILVNVTISPRPDPPVITPIGDRTIGEGETLLFAVVATDPDGDTAVLGVENLPVGARFDSALGVFTWRPDFSQAGLFENIVFTATDGADSGVEVSESISITVTDTNRPPVLNPVGNLEVREESTLTLTLTGSDPDGNAITFFMEMLPAGATFDTASSTLIYIPELGDAGDYAVQAGVRDDGDPVEEDTEAFVITVTPLDPSAVFEADAEILLADFADGDSDDDGFLSLTEAQALVSGLLESRFNAMDGNSDGLLSERELLPFATLTEEALETAARTLLNGFANADDDGDAQLTEEEARGLLSGLTAEQFMAIDGDSDGFLTEAEISAVATARAVRIEMLAEQMIAAFGDADTDDDGALSRDEAVAIEPTLTFEDFRDLDSNNDDQLGESELNTAATLGDRTLEEGAELIAEFFFDADRNGDSFVDREEAVVGIPSLTLRDFQELDSNDDGLLSRAEVEAAAAVGDDELETAAIALSTGFDGGDTNNDGTLSRTEAEAVFPGLTLEQFQELDGDSNGALSEEEVDAIASPEVLVPMAPVIVEGVAVGGLTRTSALLTWKTQVPSVASVRFGTSASSLSSTVEVDTPAGAHQVALTGLSAATTYFARVDSTFASDPLLETSGRIFSFTTPATSDTTAPVFVLSPVAGGVSDSAVLLHWTTNEFAFGEVTVGSGGGTTMHETEFAARDQSIQIDGLSPGTSYEMTVTARDASGNLSAVALMVRTLDRADNAPARLVDGVVIAHLSNTSISLRWATDRPATTEVAFSEDSDLSMVHTLPGLRTSHVMTVVGLRPLTTYMLEVMSTDWLDNGTARSTRITATTRGSAPSATPAISKAPQVIGQTDSTATLYWETDRPADSVVQYWAPGTSVMTAAASLQTLGHSTTLVGLRPNTRYQFSCTSTDIGGASVTATTTAEPGDAFGTGLVFMTERQVDGTAPRITAGPEVLASTDEGFTVRWVTDEPSDSFVRYGVQDSVGRREYQSNIPVTEHIVTLRGLISETAYQLVVSSADVAGNGPVTAAPLTATTTGSADATDPQFVAAPVVRAVFSTAALLEWETNELTSADVALQVAPSVVDSAQASAALGRQQSLALSNLSPATTYGYTLRVIDQSQNERVATGQFTTAAALFTVSPRQIFMSVGDTTQLSVTSEDPDETGFQFASQNPAIATVTASGLVTGVAPGQVDIVVAGAAGQRIRTVPTTILAIPESDDLTGFFSLLALLLLQNGDSGIIGPCFIATAAAGTPLSPEIDLLRQFRDECLLTSGVGTMMVDIYYQASPPLADWVAQSPVLAAVVRVLLLPVLVLAGLWMYSPVAVILAGALAWLTIRRIARRRYAR